MIGAPAESGPLTASAECSMPIGAGLPNSWATLEREIRSLISEKSPRTRQRWEALVRSCASDLQRLVPSERAASPSTGAASAIAVHEAVSLLRGGVIAQYGDAVWQVHACPWRTPNDADAYTYLLSACANGAATLTSVPVCRDELQLNKGDAPVGARTVYSYCGHRGSVNAVAAHPFSPLLVASGGGDGSVRLWRIPLSCVVADGREMVSTLQPLTNDNSHSVKDEGVSGLLAGSNVDAAMKERDDNSYLCVQRHSSMILDDSDLANLRDLEDADEGKNSECSADMDAMLEGGGLVPIDLLSGFNGGNEITQGSSGRPPAHLRSASQQPLVQSPVPSPLMAGDLESASAPPLGSAPVHSFTMPDDEVHALDWWLPDGKLLLAGTRSGSLLVLDAKTLMEGYPSASHIQQSSLPDVGGITHLKSTASLSGPVNAVAATSKGCILLIDQRVSTVCATVQAHKYRPCTSCTFLLDPRYILSGGLDEKIRLWDVRMDSLLPVTSYDCGRAVGPLSLSEDGAWVAAPQGNDRISLLELHGPGVCHVKQLHGGRMPVCCCFGPHAVGSVSGASPAVVEVFAGAVNGAVTQCCFRVKRD